MATNTNTAKNLREKTDQVLKPSEAPDLEYMRAKEAQLVKGQFIFHEIRGGVLDFPFRKYKYDPMEKYSLKDGEIYELPLRVARHLNSGVSYPVYDYKKTKEADAPKEKRGLVSSTSVKETNIEVTSRVNRCSFSNLEFYDIDGLSPVGSAITPIV